MAQSVCHSRCYRRLRQVRPELRGGAVATRQRRRRRGKLLAQLVAVFTIVGVGVAFASWRSNVEATDREHESRRAREVRDDYKQLDAEVGRYIKGAKLVYRASLKRWKATGRWPRGEGSGGVRSGDRRRHRRTAAPSWRERPSVTSVVECVAERYPAALRCDSAGLSEPGRQADDRPRRRCQRTDRPPSQRRGEAARDDRLGVGPALGGRYHGADRQPSHPRPGTARAEPASCSHPVIGLVAMLPEWDFGRVSRAWHLPAR
jgi:hypothetical protein